MLDIQHLVPDSPDGAGELAGGESWRVERLVLSRGREVDLSDDIDETHEVLVVTASRGVHAIDAHSRRIALRPCEPFDLTRASATRLESRDTDACVLVIEFDRRAVAVEILAFELAARRMRESLPAGVDAVLLAETGACRVRVSGEEEAFELARGEALWLSNTSRETEIEAATAGPERAGPAVAVLVRVALR